LVGTNLGIQYNSLVDNQNMRDYAVLVGTNLGIQYNSLVDNQNMRD
jgi:hypothetical protein